MNFQAAWGDYKETNRGKDAIDVFERGLSITGKDSDSIQTDLITLLGKYFKPQLEKYNYEIIGGVDEYLEFVSLDLFSLINR